MRRLLIEIESLKDLARLIVLPPPCPLNVLPIDFSRTEELIERAFRDARGYLDEVDQGQAVPLAMTMHDHDRFDPWPIHPPIASGSSPSTAEGSAG